MATPETDESGNGGEDGRGATGGKIFNGRSKNRNDKLRGRLNRSRLRDGGNFHRDRVHLAVGEHRDRTIVVGFASVLVDQFMQRWTRRHRV